MKVPSQQPSKTFADWAYLAIAKHFRKILNHETEVLKDKDPEDLHQMRVGMRRLRSAIAGFAPALNLPKTAGEKQVGRVAKTLGSLRDLDVLREFLENDYQPYLPRREQKYLDESLKYLGKERKQVFKKIKKTLKGKSYRQLKQGFITWLEQPKYEPIGSIALNTILPDLLLPQVSELLLHPGWLLGVTFISGEAQFIDGLSEKEVEKLLNYQGIILHDLRKTAKKSRYNMELFTQFYGTNYQEYVSNIKEIQTVLGDIQDSFVLVDFLTKIFKSDLQEKLPTLLDKLATNRYHKWQSWEQLQRKFLDSQVRQDLHLIISHHPFPGVIDQNSKF